MSASAHKAFSWPAGCLIRHRHERRRHDLISRIATRPIEAIRTNDDPFGSLENMLRESFERSSLNRA
jgi:hypothetical protein